MNGECSTIEYGYAQYEPDTGRWTWKDSVGQK